MSARAAQPPQLTPTKPPPDGSSARAPVPPPPAPPSGLPPANRQFPQATFMVEVKLVPSQLLQPAFVALVAKQFVSKSVRTCAGQALSTCITVS